MRFFQLIAKERKEKVKGKEKNGIFKIDSSLAASKNYLYCTCIDMPT